MFRAAERTVRLVAAHCSAEIESEYPAHLVVEHLFRSPAVAQPLKIGMSQMICIIAIGCTHSKSVSPGAELQVKAVGYCLIRVVAASPVGNNCAVEAPLPFQYVVEKVLVMADVLPLVEIV